MSKTVKIKCVYTELVSVEDLKPHPRNSNTHPTQQLERLAYILVQNGWRKPINVSKQSGYIVAGHGTLEAAKLIGVKKVPEIGCVARLMLLCCKVKGNVLRNKFKKRLSFIKYYLYIVFKSLRLCEIIKACPLRCGKYYSHGLSVSEGAIFYGDFNGKTIY